MFNLIIYMIVIAAAAFMGYKDQLLTKSGAIAAFVVGTSVAAGFGWKGLLILGIFFSTSSFWSKFKREIKSRLELKQAKGSQRDWQQVAANGGIAALSSIAYFFYDHPIWFLAFAISIASANSDTWASEIGTLSRQKPFFIRNFKRIDKGTSGAVSLLGSFAGLAGSLLIAIVSFLLFDLSENQFTFIFVFGFLGNIIDTILGAFFQATFFCSICQSETEKQVHCNKPAKLIRGLPFMNNDVVNFLSGLLAVISSLAVYII